MQSKIAHAAERKAFSVALDQIIKAASGPDREKNLGKLLDMAGKLLKDTSPGAIRGIRNGLYPGSKWEQFLWDVIDNTDHHVLKTSILNGGYEAAFRGLRNTTANAAKEQCNVPWIILFDPTSACNKHCVGCWAADYGNSLNLTYEDMDRLVTEGSELGCHLYMLTGGEPLVRKADILCLAKKHNDVQFAIYTNSTLIDEPFCEEVVKLGNIAFMLSIEGTPATNDARRGDGHYAAVMNAMDLLKAHGILFGTSICYTRDNLEAVTSDHFMRMLCDKGAHFGFYFHYMPVGNEAAPELMPTPAQRKYMIERIRYLRSEKSDIPFYPMDFQNDGEFVGGCIAGGRNYFHINSAGDAEPCVFIHYSNANIHDSSILDILRSPLFMAYHNGQPFNKNHLRPCPMLENPELLRQMVHDTGAHSTDLQSPESVDHLCDKCGAYAADWQPVADEIWSHVTLRESRYENYKDWEPAHSTAHAK